jgi:hypothetical protein
VGIGAAGSIVGLLLVSVLSSAPVADPWQQTSAGAAPAAPAPAPWPDAATLAERRREAENRNLFQSAEPLPFMLVADFKAVNRDRSPESTKTFPVTIVFARADRTTASIPLQIRTRGHSRRRPQLCDFAPLRLEFTKNQMSGTVFGGHRALKLGTHCRDVGEFEQYVLREYAAYRILNMLTPRSFRVRLAKATYVDASSKKQVAHRYGLLIEDDDDVARRMEGRISDQRGLLFRQMDQETLTLMTLFEYMIGNTDMSISEQHNVRIVQTQPGLRYPVPYDFDYSGLVNTTYSLVDKKLGIDTARDRVYRGPCRTSEELEPLFVKMRGVKPDIFAMYDGLADLNNSYRRQAKSYLEDFYRTIDRPRDVKRAFIDGCLKAGM